MQAPHAPCWACHRWMSGPAPPADLRFEVSVRRSDGAAKRRGIYLRDPADTRQPLTFQ